MEGIFTRTCGQLVPLFKPKSEVVATPLGVYTMHSMAALQTLGESGQAGGNIEQYTSYIKKFLKDTPEARKNKIIISTDDEKAAMKAAIMYLKMRKKEVAKAEEDEWDFGYDDSLLADDSCAADDVENQYAIMDARDYKSAVCETLNSFLTVESLWIADERCVAVHFLGVEAVSDKRSYVNAVAGCKKQYVILHIPKNLENDVEIQRLVYEHDFSFLRLPENGNSYYVALIDKMLKDSSYTMWEGFNTADFLNKCRQRWGGCCSEDRLAQLFDYAALNARKDGRGEIKTGDFEPMLYMGGKKTYDELMDMTGLYRLKETCRRFMALELEKKRNPKADIRKRHMLFYGRPGTGKSMGAEILAKIMAEAGIGNGKFVKASRKDLVGAYVGHTAVRVAEKFEEAKGGILFVDEAGFFIQKNSGEFVKEAIKEFVRYMETEDVTVIFAMYPQEKEQFLEIDAGLASRIEFFVRFDDYGEDELVAIATNMLRGFDYSLPQGCEPMLKSFFRKMKNNMGEKFGNARECRKLADEIVMEISLRNMCKSVKQQSELAMPELKRVLERIYENTKVRYEDLRQRD